MANSISSNRGACIGKLLLVTVIVVFFAMSNIYMVFAKPTSYYHVPLHNLSEDHSDYIFSHMSLESVSNELFENLKRNFSDTTIVFTNASDLRIDCPVTMQARDEWISSFKYVMVYHPNWARYVRAVHFVNYIEGVNFAVVFTRFTNENNFGRIHFGVYNNLMLGNSDIRRHHNITNITFHEIAHIMDTFDNVNTRGYYAVYTGKYSTYKVNGNNFYQLWSTIAYPNNIHSNIREAFAIAVGRYMANKIVPGVNAHIPDSFIPFVQQLANDIAAGRSATPPNHDVRLTRFSNGRDVTDGEFQLATREKRYDSFFTTFDIINIVDREIENVTITLSDFRLNGISSYISPFTLGAYGTSTLIRDIGNLSSHSIFHFNVRTHSGLQLGNHSARVTVTSTINGVEVIHRFFILQITIISTYDIRLTKSSSGRDVTDGGFQLATREAILVINRLASKTYYLRR